MEAADCETASKSFPVKESSSFWSLEISIFTFGHGHLANNFFTQEISNFDLSTVVGDVDVDGKMCINVAHLVLIALGYTNNHVVDQ